MMTFEMIMAAIEGLGDDVIYGVIDREIHVTLCDFEGFDDDWCEIMRDYDDEQAVEDFLQMLADECLSSDGDFYEYYEFDGFTVKLGYESFDI